jgi:hypothetical protein
MPGSTDRNLTACARLLAAIGICPLAAISGYPETASFVTEAVTGSWRGRAGNRLVRSSLEAVRIGAGSDVVLVSGVLVVYRICR